MVVIEQPYVFGVQGFYQDGDHGLLQSSAVFWLNKRHGKSGTYSRVETLAGLTSVPVLWHGRSFPASVGNSENARKGVVTLPRLPLRTRQACLRPCPASTWSLPGRPAVLHLLRL